MSEIELSDEVFPPLTENDKKVQKFMDEVTELNHTRNILKKTELSAFNNAKNRIIETQKTLDLYRPAIPEWVGKYNYDKPLVPLGHSQVGANITLSLILSGVLALFGSLVGAGSDLSTLSFGGAGLIGALSFLYWGAYSFGGDNSPVFQPIRRFLAHTIIPKKLLKEFEMRIFEKKAYQDAIKVYDLLVERTCLELEKDGVFEIVNKVLNSDNRVMGLNDKGLFDYEYIKLPVVAKNDNLSLNTRKNLNLSNDITHHLIEEMRKGQLQIDPQNGMVNLPQRKNFINQDKERKCQKLSRLKKQPFQ